MKAADLPAVAKTVAMGANLYAGQTCISTQRIYVVGGAFDAFKEHLVKEYNALSAGDPSDPKVCRWTHHRQRSFRAHR